uniref:Uncharacterized protein n=1 Tax=Anguilla anguilla TaxID=7936 RepID=A0A0E9WR41_ANGAN
MLLLKPRTRAVVTVQKNAAPSPLNWFKPKGEFDKMLLVKDEKRELNLFCFLIVISSYACIVDVATMAFMEDNLWCELFLRYDIIYF